MSTPPPSCITLYRSRGQGKRVTLWVCFRTSHHVKSRDRTDSQTQLQSTEKSLPSFPLLDIVNREAQLHQHLGMPALPLVPSFISSGRAGATSTETRLQTAALIALPVAHGPFFLGEVQLGGFRDHLHIPYLMPKANLSAEPIIEPTTSIATIFR